MATGAQAPDVSSTALNVYSRGKKLNTVYVSLPPLTIACPAEKKCVLLSDSISCVDSTGSNRHLSDGRSYMMDIRRHMFFSAAAQRPTPEQMFQVTEFLD